MGSFKLNYLALGNYDCPPRISRQFLFIEPMPTYHITNTTVVRKIKNSTMLDLHSQFIIVGTQQKLWC